jgi:hypothetical protein
VMIDCCLKPNEQFFSYILARTSCILMRWYPLYSRPTSLVGFLYFDSSLKQVSGYTSSNFGVMIFVIHELCTFFILKITLFSCLEPIS